MRTLVATAVVCLIASASVHSAEVVRLAQAGATTRFEIPAGQSLATAIRSLVSQANTNVMFDEAAVEGKTVERLEMEGTLEEALKKLLVGTGLEWRFLNEATVVVGKAGSLPK